MGGGSLAFGTHGPLDLWEKLPRRINRLLIAAQVELLGEKWFTLALFEPFAQKERP